jgi:peptidyl-prolyl cis-trans isomerase SurA
MPIVGPESAIAEYQSPAAETKHLTTGRILRRARHAAAAGLLLSLLFPALQAGRPMALAQDTLRAVAVVNDEVISMLDLFMRTRLAALSSGIELTPESQSRLQQQVLRRLIDERLQLQEAERLSITISDEEVADALNGIARRNKLSNAQFETMLAQNQILPSALQEQVKAELAWRNVVRVRLVPTIVIADEEIDEVVARIEAGRGGSQINLSEIYLEVESVQVEDEVRRSATGLLEELRGGGDFSALASQFSQSATAAKGGNIGWIEETQLPEELASVVRGMKVGEVSGPVRGLTGYYILFLRNRKTISGGEVSVRLTQIFLDMPPEDQQAERAARLAEAENLRAQIDSCATAEEIAKASGAPGSGDLGLMNVTDLSPKLRSLVESLPLEQPSEAINIAGSLAILVVCERQGGAIDRSRIENNLMAQRVENLARRYLRDLRRQANVDLRL